MDQILLLVPKYNDIIYICSFISSKNRNPLTNRISVQTTFDWLTVMVNTVSAPQSRGQGRASICKRGHGLVFGT